MGIEVEVGMRMAMKNPKVAQSTVYLGNPPEILPKITINCLRNHDLPLKNTSKWLKMSHKRTHKCGIIRKMSDFMPKNRSISGLK